MDNDHPEDHYGEEWILIMGNNEWVLDKREAGILKEAIRQGNRGIVVFDSLVVNIPFIKEFYLDRRFLKPEYQIAPPEKVEVEETEDQRIERLKKWEEAKKKTELLNKNISGKSIVNKPMTPREFEERRQELLKQAEKL